MQKRRYQEDGFNLDLTYITPRVIAMGFPSEGTESLIRNPMSEWSRSRPEAQGPLHGVQPVLGALYDPRNFQNRVKLFPFDDHNPPPLRMIPALCQSLQEYSTRTSSTWWCCKASRGAPA